MPKPRKAQVSLEATPYYHCVSRCVRHAFLCGTDSHTGQSYEHRREWIEERLYELAGIFAIDLCAYAVMSNHYHLVLHVDRAMAESWDGAEVVRRWQALFTGHPLAKQFLNEEPLSKMELAFVKELVTQWQRSASRTTGPVRSGDRCSPAQARPVRPAVCLRRWP